jgi:hypothetical protein
MRDVRELPRNSRKSAELGLGMRGERGIGGTGAAV